MNVSDFLEREYYNIKNPVSFSSVKKLLNLAKQNGFPETTKTDVQKFLNSQDLYTKYFVSRKKFRRRRIFSPSIDAVWDVGF
jgi:hypothetical protein